MQLVARLGRISGYSFILVSLTFLGLYGGIKLDHATGMAPDFTLVGLGAGIVIGFMNFIHEVRRERNSHTRKP